MLIMVKYALRDRRLSLSKTMGRRWECMAFLAVREAQCWAFFKAPGAASHAFV